MASRLTILHVEGHEPDLYYGQYISLDELIEDYADICNTSIDQVKVLLNCQPQHGGIISAIEVADYLTAKSEGLINLTLLIETVARMAFETGLTANSVREKSN